MADEEFKAPKSVAHRQAGQGEKYVQGPIHGEPHPEAVASTKTSVEAKKAKEADDEVHVQGPIHGA